MSETVDVLPKPFFDDGWSRSVRPHARALWDFHRALAEAEMSAEVAESEADRVLAQQPLNAVPPAVTDRAYETAATYNVPAELLASQVRASQTFRGPIRFADGPAVGAFIADWAHAHGRALAHLAGVSGSWQTPYVDEFSTAFFWVGRLVTLKRDLDRDWLFIPESDLDRAGVTVGDLKKGEMTEPVRRVLWKQTIRAKDAFAQSEQLVIDLPRRHANAAKRWWIGGLEVLNEIRRRDYDVWSEPVTLSTFHRLQVRFQARFGRTTFRSR